MLFRGLAYGAVADKSIEIKVVVKTRSRSRLESLRAFSGRWGASHIKLSLNSGTLAAAHIQCTLSTLIVPKDHELTKLQPPNDFKIRNSDDLHVMILLQYSELIG